MSVLSHADIVGAIKSGRLVCSPLMDWDQVGDASLDFRIGTYFILFRRARRPCLDIREEHAPSSPEDFQEHVHVGLGGKLILAPGMLALGSTLEFFRLPPDLGCDVITRSSWGRVGVIIATATWVHPSFRGCLTLEILNHANSAVAVYPGERIGQLVFHECKHPRAISRRAALNQGVTKPEYSKLFEREQRDQVVDSISGWHPSGRNIEQ